MTLLDTLLRVVQPRASIEDPGTPLTGQTLLDVVGGPRTNSGVTVTETSSLGMAAVWRAVNLTAGTAAALPLHAFRKQDESRQPLMSGQAALLLEAPHPDLTPFEFWEIIYAHLLLWGNAYIWIGRDQLGVIRELWPLHPSRVRAGRTSEGRKIYAVDGALDEHDDNTILHIPGFGYDGVCGVAPIRAARETIGLAFAAEQFGASLFGNGSLATGLLQTEQRLEPEQADELQRRWKAKQSGLKSAHETIVLDSGAKFEKLTIPPEDAQFIESRSFQIEEVARWFGTPPHMLMALEKSTSWGTGIGEQTLGWVKFSLQPSWLTRVEQRVSRLLRGQQVYAKYNLDGLLRGDVAARGTFYNTLWQLGVLSTNEIRALENRAPVDGGDVRYRPLNMGELGKFDEPTATSSKESADAAT